MKMQHTIYSDYDLNKIKPVIAGAARTINNIRKQKAHPIPSLLISNFNDLVKSCLIILSVSRDRVLSSRQSVNLTVTLCK